VRDKQRGNAPRVVTLGEAMLRMSTRDRLERATSLTVHVAGAEANVAAAMAQLGWRATWLSRLPDVPAGRRVANELALAGVDVSHITWTDSGRVGLFFAEFAARPRSTMVWYDRADSAATRLCPDDLNPEVLDRATYAVLSGITPAISASARRLSEVFVAEARQRGVTVCVDVNYRSRLWSAEAARPVILSLIAQADIVVCSARDARLLWDIDSSDDASVIEMRDRCAPQSKLLVLTDQARGCIGLSADGSVIRQAAYPVDIVDRFGAGDAFVAGLLWGLHGGTPDRALRTANAAAALKCGTAGDQLIATADELEELVTSQPTEAIVR
jgi:2-dehydro-3-deoxygluconokinase